MRFAFLLLMVVPAAFGHTGEAVHSRFSVKENADVDTLLRVSSELSNDCGKWCLLMANRRAHGKDPRKFTLSIDNGRRAGFCKLCGLMHLEVNGYLSRDLQLNRNCVREYADGERKGVEFSLNFDGVVMRTRFWMRPGSPRLWAEVCRSGKSLEPVADVKVGLTALPSFLEVMNGKSRFDGYRRSVRTASRCVKPCKRASVPIRTDDHYFIFQDEDYDGSAIDKGVGPVAVFLEADCKGCVRLNDGWLTDLCLTPNPKKPLRFSLLEYPEERVSNDEFERRVRREELNRE